MSEPDELVEQLEKNKGELNERIGMRFIEASKDHLVATMPVEGNRQPFGLLHGGASIALAETLGSVLAALQAGDDGKAVGVDMNATHHRSATSGTVTGTARVLHGGRRVVTTETVVTDEQGRRLCTARLTCLIL